MWTASARHQYRRSAARYATDVTDAEFALVEPLLPAARRGGRRRTTLLREVVNALLYLRRTGCPWRMLPREFPPRSTVYGHFRRLWEEGVRSAIQATLLMAARGQAGREALPTSGIVTAWAWSVPGFEGAFRGSSACSPMPATRATSPAAPRRVSNCGSRSLNAPSAPKASTCCRDALCGLLAAPPSGIGSSASRRMIGRRAHLRLAGTQSAARQGLRAADRHLDRNGHPRHHPNAHPAAGKPLIGKAAFRTGS